MRDGERAYYLFEASCKGNVSMVKMMLEQGADIEYVGNDVTGATPLLAATQEGHVEVVRMLLEHGADADKVRKDGGAYYSLRGATGSWPKRASNFGFPGRGQVWNHTHAHVIDGKHSNDSEGENIKAVEIDVEN